MLLAGIPIVRSFNVPPLSSLLRRYSPLPPLSAAPNREATDTLATDAALTGDLLDGVSSFDRFKTQLLKTTDSLRWIDGYEKEANRKDRRTVYTFADWENHRSSGRFIQNLITMPSSRIIRSLWLEVSSVVLVALFIVGYNGWNASENFPYPKIFMTPVPLELSSPVLGLLLVFRTNNAYARWLDGRNAWGLICARIRSIVMESNIWLRLPPSSSPSSSSSIVQAESLVDSLGNPVVDIKDYYTDLILRHCLALPYTLKCHLRANEEEELISQLKPLLGDEATAACMGSPHRPLWVIKHISMLIKHCTVERLFTDNSLAIARIQEYIRDIIAAMDTCERIVKTPLPLVYTR
jgi:ion channel-forming bestrophin family protein